MVRNLPSYTWRKLMINYNDSCLVEILLANLQAIRGNLGRDLQDADAEDALQDTCLSYLEAMDRGTLRLAGRKVLPSWIRQRALWRKLDLIRNRKRFVRNPCHTDVETVADRAGIDEIDRLVCDEEREYLQILISQAAPELRQVLKLRIEGFSYRQIAARLNSSVCARQLSNHVNQWITNCKRENNNAG
jgi:RNA polymerase sigma factor (sigma-70 family)